ncbi:hypothetical protein AV530_018635 [Patagioenas fasciata monilis]|uniref:Uncharacterized protein n=1 Tax=Patagioenas fasciata monilis TaxID=372326 RepID=A0A1V4JHU7_PATFA|nr:hypothetical protein AV530_018635 [Patagioenas fasciata monilis]
MNRDSHTKGAGVGTKIRRTRKTSNSCILQSTVNMSLKDTSGPKNPLAIKQAGGILWLEHTEMHPLQPNPNLPYYHCPTCLETILYNALWGSSWMKGTIIREKGRDFYPYSGT